MRILIIKILPYLILLLPLSCSSCQKEKDFTNVVTLDKDLFNLINDFIEDDNLAGMGLLYYSDKYGKLSLATGQSDIERNIPMDTSSIYDIGSTTKMFISILILQLIEEGRITFDTPIQNWINNIPSDSAITIRHLLNHTSGFNDYLSNASFLEEYYDVNNNDFTLDNIITAGLVDSTNIRIGAWKYSNTNYLILAKIIESITNNTVEKELKQKIFDKAGMINTYYMPAHNVEQISKLATGYQFDKAMKTDKNYFLYNAAGGIVSTLGDMENFAKWLMNSSYLSKMIYKPLDCTIENGLETNYGQGIIIAKNIFETNMMGHGGTTFGFKSEFWFSPETGEIIIYFANDYMYKKNYSNFRKKLNIVLQKYK